MIKRFVLCSLLCFAVAGCVPSERPLDVVRHDAAGLLGSAVARPESHPGMPVPDVRGNAQARPSERVVTMAQLPKPARKDPALEAQMRKVASATLDGSVVLRAIIKSSDWAYDRNKLGQIVDRYQTAYIIYQEGGVHRVMEMGFKQPYNGRTYGALALRGVGLYRAIVSDYR